MPRQATVSIENNFSAGLVTEVTGVNSPENSVVSTNNVEYDRKGRARRRLGLDYEDDFTKSVIVDTGGVNEFVWENVAGGSFNSFVVIKIGSAIHFWSVVSGQSLSSSKTSFAINLDSYRIPNFTLQQVAETPCSFASGKGYLFVAHPYCDPIYVKYDLPSNNLVTSPITVSIRDFEGVEDGLAIDTRPGSLSAAHRYNLFNQGWYQVDIDKKGGAYVQNVLDNWAAERPDFPSNADIWWTFMDPQVDDGGFDPRYTVKGLTNTPAPKGHYFFNAFQTARGSIQPGVPETTSNGQRPSVVSFFGGRVFYAGVKADKYSNTIYFSQIVERDDQLGKCYQQNDPTSEEAFDLLSADGGTIQILDIVDILDMRVIGPSMYVFASNGVWSITGANDSGFKATDYVVSKVSSFPAISKLSIVDVGGLPIWWNYEGIFALKKDQVGLSTEITNLSESRIQSLYDEIPNESKVYAKGYFNDLENVVYFLYRDIPVRWFQDNYVYNKVLVFDVISTAFYTHTIPESPSEIKGLIAVRTNEFTTINDPVLNNVGQPVTDNTGVPITIEIAGPLVIRGKTFKFLTKTASNAAWSFMEFNDEAYLDMRTDTGSGIDYMSEFVTGYRIRGDLLRKFQSNYATFILDTQPEASCFVEGIWDYSINPESLRYTTPQQLYLPKNFRGYQRRKLKIRGSGYSLQFQMRSETGKPFSIVGWAVFETSNAVA